MRKKITIYIIVVVAAVIAIAGIIGYQIWNKPHQDIKDAKAIETTAVDFYTNLANISNQKSASFINKVVAVAGTVKEVSKNRLGQQVILLKTSVDGGSLNCTMEQPADNVMAGATVVIKGVCTGYIEGDKDMDLPGDVYLTRCYQLK
ncbi:MAG TPA: hypothetical protein VN726_02555 [Hanamia sp.]|nr:hypothetical protein [Hanamia sp.]